MTDTLRQTAPTDEKRSGWRLRWSLGTLMLFVACVCVWTTYFQLRIANPQLLVRIEAMQRLQTTLIVDDPRQIAVAQVPPKWIDEAKWNVYLPSGHKYRLCLATDDIANPQQETGPAPPVRAEHSLVAGNSAIELQQERTSDGWSLVVLVNDEPVLTVDESAEWNPARGSEGGARFRRTEQQPVTDRVLLYRRRFSRPGGIKRTLPTTGIELWIEEGRK